MVASQVYQVPFLQDEWAYVALVTGCAVAWGHGLLVGAANSTDFFTDVLIVIVGTMWLALCGVALWREWRLATLIERVLGASPSGVIVRRIVRDGKKTVGLPIVFANREAVKLAGGGCQREGWSRFFPGELDEGAFEEYCHVAESGCSRAFEKHFVQDGRSRWLAVHVTKIEDEEIVATLVEITKRKQAEERLRHDEELLEMTGRMTKAGGWEVLYPGGRCIGRRRSMRFTRSSPDSSPRSSGRCRSFPPVALAKLKTAFEDCEREGIPYDLEMEFITALHRPRWVRAMGRAEFNAESCGVSNGTFQDITDHARLARIASRTSCGSKKLPPRCPAPSINTASRPRVGTVSPM